MKLLCTRLYNDRSIGCYERINICSSSTLRNMTGLCFSLDHHWIYRTSILLLPQAYSNRGCLVSKITLSSIYLPPTSD
ncbi:hypothetical protein Mapa_012014 [Marchantia paleacea]|nr:hypothetical protein Mapa_012014 [Marchantia paleacea]